MPKGLISQTVVVLFREEIEVGELRSLLTEFNVVREIEAAKDWEFGGPALLVEYLPEVNGYAQVDIVDRPWPDHMGNPKEEITLFGAWSMGWFGPFTYPGGLRRALEQSWTWPEAKELVPQHTAFVRIRMSYVFGAAKEAKCLPENYKPQAELDFITTLASTLLQHPQALGYFNPNGEVVRSKLLLDQAVIFANEHDLPALDIWTNVRLFNINPEWLLMDTVGNRQLDIRDLEVAFPKDKVSPQEADRWLRNVTLYILKNKTAIKDGDTVDGPANLKWRARTFEKGMSDPPRDVLRLLPYEVENIPPGLLEEKVKPPKEAAKEKPKWKFW